MARSIRPSTAERIALQRRGRRRSVAILATSGGALALAATLVVTLTAAPSHDDESIRGLTTFGTLPQTHTTSSVDYATLFGMDPPAGGPHDPIWLNSGRYDLPVRNENAVHSLEHGAVWVTYNPDLVTEDQVTAMCVGLPSTYLIVSPYPGLDCPVAVSAWSAQVKLDGPDDPRLAQFVEVYWQSPDAPEPGAPLTGGVTDAGLVTS
jgi:hypothetical protein